MKKLSEEDIWKALEGQENVLAPLVEKEQSLITNSVCPNCGATSSTFRVNAARPFSPGSPLPNKVMSCGECGAEFDPKSKLITKKPTAG